MALRRVFENATGLFRGRWWQPGNPLSPRVSLSGEVPAMKTGFAQLDRALGTGGLPQGCLTELIGPELSGVLSIAAKIGAKFQRKQLPVTIMDMAGSFELDHATRCGLIAPELFTYQPRTAYELISQMERATRQEGLILLNLGFVPETFGREAPAASLASLLYRLRQIIRNSKSATLCLTLPQDMDPFIHTNYLPGFPLNEVAEVRLWVQDEGWIKRRGEISGYRGNVTVVKNTLGPSGKGANLRIPFVDPALERLTEELGF
jgi:hypothetical protein